MINAILLRSNALYCSFQCETMDDVVESALEHVELQERYVKDGISKDLYVKLFVSIDGKELEEIDLDTLR